MISDACHDIILSTFSFDFDQNFNN